MYNYIINPVTNRKVSVYGKLGKKIINNYLNIKNGGSTASVDKTPTYKKWAEIWPKRGPPVQRVPVAKQPTVSTTRGAVTHPGTPRPRTNARLDTEILFTIYGINSESKGFYSILQNEPMLIKSRNTQGDIKKRLLKNHVAQQRKILDNLTPDGKLANDYIVSEIFNPVINKMMKLNPDGSHDYDNTLVQEQYINYGKPIIVVIIKKKK